MLVQQGAAVPCLVALAPDSCRGRRIELSGEYMTVGRDPGCDVRFDDPHMSRTHAALQRRGDAVYVQDLGSSGGTFVNGTQTTGTQLSGGDVLGFGAVRARFETASPVIDDTRPMPAQVGQGPGHYVIGRQEGEAISNVGRDQYNASIQQVVEQRDSFLREIAATRTKARWLIRLGSLLFVTGFGLFVWADLSLIRQFSQEWQSNAPPPTTTPFGRDIGGIPFVFIGWAMGAAGALLLAVGIVLHIVAASRRRHVERDFSPALRWPQGGQ